MRTGPKAAWTRRRRPVTIKEDHPYHCPICLRAYATREEKAQCLRARHGYRTLDVTPRNEQD